MEDPACDVHGPGDVCCGLVVVVLDVDRKHSTAVEGRREVPCRLKAGCVERVENASTAKGASVGCGRGEGAVSCDVRRRMHGPWYMDGEAWVGVVAIEDAELVNAAEIVAGRGDDGSSSRS